MKNEITLINEIKELELKLLNPAVRKSASILSNILSDDFIEFGSSGKTYNKQQTIDALQNEKTVTINISDFKIRSISPDVLLALYTAEKIVSTNYSKNSLRSSLWIKQNDNWQIMFHQGTNINQVDNS